MTSKEYLKLNRKLQVAVIGRYDPIEGYQMALHDWEIDTGDSDYLTFAMFKKSWFQLVDLWTEEVSEEEYVAFLDQLIQRLLRRSSVSSDILFRNDSDILSTDEYQYMQEYERILVPDTPAEVFRMYSPN